MANVSFQIGLKGGEAVGDVLRFEPGSRLEGLVQVTPAEDIKSRRVVMRVGWHTEGRGGRDQATVGELQLAEGPLTANTPLSQPFAVDLPREPWSYAGHLINIVWTVQVVIDVPLSGDIVGVQPFVVVPRRLELFKPK